MNEEVKKWQWRKKGSNHQWTQGTRGTQETNWVVQVQVGNASSADVGVADWKEVSCLKSKQHHNTPGIKSARWNLWHFPMMERDPPSVSTGPAEALRLRRGKNKRIYIAWKTSSIHWDISDSVWAKPKNSWDLTRRNVSTQEGEGNER